MSREPPAKRVRKGTKSCTQCRYRKVRCIWPSEGATVCQGCEARGRTCELQLYMTPASEGPRVTSRARIAHLENEVSILRTAVRALQEKLGYEASVDSLPQPSRSPREAGSFGEEQSHYDSETDSSELSPSQPPAHLLQLFDNEVLGTDSRPETSYQTLNLHKSQGNVALRALMPSREAMLTITAHASSWLSIHNSLFPTSVVTKTAVEMLSWYDVLQSSNSDSVAIAALLLSVAITLLQTPDETAARVASSIGDRSTFIKTVSDTVERVIISDDTLAGTLEGIETILLYLRLQLGRAKFRKTWLLLRRVIALAELTGLPRTSMVTAQYQGSSVGESNGGQIESHSPPSAMSRKAAVWEAICAIDRIASLMWSLPLATARYPLPKRPLLDLRGRVVPKSFLYHLTDIASRVLELDKMHSSGKPLSELFSAVISIDQELRNLTTITPKKWWRTHWPELSVDALLQYWHQYFTVRAHLKLALLYDHDEGQQYAFNFVACLEACESLANRYVSLRTLLPMGFFASWLIDLQVFTGAAFLLLASYRTTHGSGRYQQAVDVETITNLAEDVVRIMKCATDRARGDFVRQAPNAIRSLISLLQQSPTSEAQKMTLNIPLVGRIHVSRKSHAGEHALESSTRQGPQESWQNPSSNEYGPDVQAMQSEASYTDLMNPLSYSMEFQDNFTFLTDEMFGTEEWLT